MLDELMSRGLISKADSKVLLPEYPLLFSIITSYIPQSFGLAVLAAADEPCSLYLMVYAV